MYLTSNRERHSSSIPLSSIDEFSPQTPEIRTPSQDCGLRTASRACMLHLQQCIHASIRVLEFPRFPVQQMRAGCDLLSMQSPAVILAWRSLQVGWVLEEPFGLLLTSLSVPM